MHRHALKILLNDYRRSHPREDVTDRFFRFVESHTNCFERSLEQGHVTASAWIVDKDANSALLVHHKKLGLWLQPGGHCDGDSDVVRVATKEVQEETGLDTFEIVSDRIFDLDIHEIPVWEKTPAHYHYDVRFLIYADRQQPLRVSHESNDIRWFNLNKIQDVSPDISVVRLAGKSLTIIT